MARSVDCLRSVSSASACVDSNAAPHKVARRGINTIHGSART
jgi:hypothetical protein